MLEHEICPELGLEYVKLWRDECGSTLLDLIIPSHDRPCGRFVVAATKMPSEVTLGRLKCGVNAPRGEYHCADPWLRSRVLRFVGSHKHNVCIFESPYTPMNGELEGVTADILLLRDQRHYCRTYRVLHQQNAGEQYVDKVITDSDSAWGFSGALLTCDRLASLVGRREILQDDLVGIADNAEGVFVSVFDAESYLIWEIVDQEYGT